MKFTSLFCSTLLAAPMLLSAQSSFSITSDFAYASDYVFRGIHYADESLQPSISFSAGNLYASVWTNQPITGGTDNEFDFTLGYALQLNDTWALDLGATYYDYPETTGNVEQLEPYLGLTATLANGFSSSTYLYYESEFEVTTLSTVLGYSQQLQDTLSLDLAAEVGGVMPDADDDYTYWALSAQLTHALNDTASAYLGVTYSNTDLDHSVRPDGKERLFLTTGLQFGF
ncbi:TorF family putative porin [Actomonas aquatica]|uniref:TorF family putative porin n=1 Tax=Actomonas aquatica TaxID=2866162 RepID=A0ABZ1CE99_9BACT|nr:TorF family putative porin [Opitutus sp. WL0086]WRQ89999.1 TorF family putative porin [Opitutus sp. WL0086]